MKKIIEKLVNTTPAQLLDYVRHPGMIKARLAAPQTLSAVEAFAALFPELGKGKAESLRLEFLGNSSFFEEINKQTVAKRHRRMLWQEWHEFLYVAARMLEPEIIVESGVFDGRSSAVFLQALNDNGKGTLVSIDLPASKAADRPTHGMDEVLPPGCGPGWIIPETLRERHRLELGDSKKLLPKLLDEYPEIDIFFHDSLHTFEHQYFEYSAAWTHLPEKGLLLSDDIFWSPAYHKFCKEKNRQYARIGDFGAARR